MTATADISPEFTTQISNILHDYNNVDCQYFINIPEIDETMVVTVKYDNFTKTHVLFCVIVDKTQTSHITTEIMGKSTNILLGFQINFPIAWGDVEYTFNYYGQKTKCNEYVNLHSYCAKVIELFCRHIRINRICVKPDILENKVCSQLFGNQYQIVKSTRNNYLCITF